MLPTSRTTSRLLVLVAVACVAVSLLPSAAAAATTTTKRDRWQVVTSVGPRFEADGGNLFRVPPPIDRFMIGRVRWIVTWDAFSSVARSQTIAMRTLEPGNGVLLDRPLSRGELVRLKQRVLWYEAEVLAVHPANPACASGLTRAQAVGLLDGTITDWNSIVPAGSWPTSFVPLVHGYRPTQTRTGYLEPFFGVTAYGAELRPSSPTSARSAIAGDEHAFAPLRYSDVRGRTDVCAPAIDGIRPDDTTVKSATYPSSFAVRWVTSRSQNLITRRALARFETHLFGARGAAYLRTEAGRNRLR